MLEEMTDRELLGWRVRRSMQNEYTALVNAGQTHEVAWTAIYTKRK